MASVARPPPPAPAYSLPRLRWRMPRLSWAAFRCGRGCGLVPLRLGGGAYGLVRRGQVIVRGCQVGLEAGVVGSLARQPDADLQGPLVVLLGEGVLVVVGVLVGQVVVAAGQVA